MQTNSPSSQVYGYVKTSTWENILNDYQGVEGTLGYFDYAQDLNVYASPLRSFDYAQGKLLRID